MRILPQVHPLGRQPPLLGALRKLGEEPGLCLLESADGQNDEWSWLFFEPLPSDRPPESLAELRGLLERLELAAVCVPGPFRAGFVGALSYDLGIAGERRVWCEEDPWRWPKIVGGLRTDFLVRESRTGEAWLVLGHTESAPAESAARRAARIRALLAQPAPAFEAPQAMGALERHTTPAQHRERVQRMRQDIAAGDYYQANLAHSFTRAVRGHPVRWYERLCERNPAPYMGYLDFGCGALLSASPELLLESRGTRLVTRPIKGTRPRARDAAQDQALARELLASEKDRAELAMIVDLARNDLGRVSRTSSVRVEGGFPRLESYASVHHLMADVVGELKPELDSFDALAAVFPGASITGAPKLASMAAIARAEGEGRSFFTGSLGWIDRSGDSSWNILIRTLLYRSLGAGHGEFRFSVGGGITHASDPQAEEEETLVKAARLLETLSP